MSDCLTHIWRGLTFNPSMCWRHILCECVATCVFEAMGDWSRRSGQSLTHVWCSICSQLLAAQLYKYINILCGGFLRSCFFSDFHRNIFAPIHGGMNGCSLFSNNARQAEDSNECTTTHWALMMCFREQIEVPLCFFWFFCRPSFMFEIKKNGPLSLKDTHRYSQPCVVMFSSHRPAQFDEMSPSELCTGEKIQGCGEGGNANVGLARMESDHLLWVRGGWGWR